MFLSNTPEHVTFGWANHIRLIYHQEKERYLQKRAFGVCSQFLGPEEKIQGLGSFSLPQNQVQPHKFHHHSFILLFESGILFNLFKKEKEKVFERMRLVLDFDSIRYLCNCMCYSHLQERVYFKGKATSWMSDWAGHRCTAYVNSEASMNEVCQMKILFGFVGLPKSYPLCFCTINSKK